jgi:hypothetical protein
MKGGMSLLPTGLITNAAGLMAGAVIGAVANWFWLLQQLQLKVRCCRVPFILQRRAC